MKIVWAVITDAAIEDLEALYTCFISETNGNSNDFDKDAEVWIAKEKLDFEQMTAFLTKNQIEYDEYHLLLLPTDAKTSPEFEDYGFQSETQHRYLFAQQVVLFRLEETSDASEKMQALAQIQEHLIAEYRELEPDHPLKHRSVYVVDKQFPELIQGIARAYRCHAEFINNLE